MSGLESLVKSVPSTGQDSSYWFKFILARLSEIWSKGSLSQACLCYFTPVRISDLEISCKPVIVTHIPIGGIYSIRANTKGVCKNTISTCSLLDTCDNMYLILTGRKHQLKKKLCFEQTPKRYAYELLLEKAWSLKLFIHQTFWFNY